MKALLIKLKEPGGFNTRPTFTPPIGLWSMAEAARQHGDECDVVDLHIGDKIPAGEYASVGISVQFSTQHDEYLQTAEYVRRTWPKAQIIAGGFHAAAVAKPEEVDAVCRGSGEAFLYARCKPTCPRPTAEQMIPYWERKAPHHLKSEHFRWMPIETSRGCPRRCRFCAVPGYWGRPQTIPHLDRYMDHLRTIGVQELLIEDDNLFWGEDVLERLALLSPFVWSTPNGIDIRKMAPYMDHLDGCRKMSLPFETGSPATAKAMGLGNKWHTEKEAAAVALRLRDLGIETCGFFIIGYPGETLAEIHRTLDYANDLPLDERQIYIATPYPGTDLYAMCRERGYLRYDGEELYRRLQYTEGCIDTPEWTGEQLVEIREADRAAAMERRGLI